MDSLRSSDGLAGSVFGLGLRHKGKIVLMVAVCVGLGILYLAFTPRAFLSEAKLYVRQGHESGTLDPTATNGQVIAAADSRESEINAITELFTSRTMAEQVVDRFGNAAILEKKPGRGGLRLGERLAFLDSWNLNPLQVYSVRDKAIKHFQESLGVRAGKRTNVIAVSYKAEDPRHAHDVVEAMVQVARDEYLRVNRTGGSQEFFDGQSELLKAELETAEAKLRDLKNETGLASLPQQRELELERIGQLEDQLVLALAERDAVEAEIATRQQQLADLPQMVVTEQVSGQPNTPEFGMREKLYELEIKEKELSSKLTDVAPQLIALRQQIADSRQVVTEEEAKIQITRGLNKTHEAVELALWDKQAQLIALSARSKSLDAKVAAAKESIKRINEHELQIAQVQRAIDLAQTNYRKYAENLEQARIDQELDSAKISSLNPLQPPSFSETPVGPKPLQVIALSILSGICGGFGLALAFDRRRPTGTDDLSASTPLPSGSPARENGHPQSTPQPSARLRRPEHVPVHPR